MSLGYLVILGIFALISSLVSKRLKAKFKKYSQVHLKSGLSGKQIAERMLASNGITDVKIIVKPSSPEFIPIPRKAPKKITMLRMRPLIF